MRAPRPKGPSSGSTCKQTDTHTHNLLHALLTPGPLTPAAVAAFVLLISVSAGGVGSTCTVCVSVCARTRVRACARCALCIHPVSRHLHSEACVACMNIHCMLERCAAIYHATSAPPEHHTPTPTHIFRPRIPSPQHTSCSCVLLLAFLLVRLVRTLELGHSI